MMKITVNDKTQEMTEGSSITDLLDELNLNADTVVVECDQAIIQRDNYRSTILQEGSKLELIRFVGGG